MCPMFYVQYVMHFHPEQARNETQMATSLKSQRSMGKSKTNRSTVKHDISNNYADASNYFQHTKNNVTIQNHKQNQQQQQQQQQPIHKFRTSCVDNQDYVVVEVCENRSFITKVDKKNKIYDNNINDSFHDSNEVVVDHDVYDKSLSSTSTSSNDIIVEVDNDNGSIGSVSKNDNAISNTNELGQLVEIDLNDIADDDDDDDDDDDGGGSSNNDMGRLTKILLLIESNMEEDKEEKLRQTLRRDQNENEYFGVYGA
eukprot:Pgem_evm2s1056